MSLGLLSLPTIVRRVRTMDTESSKRLDTDFGEYFLMSRVAGDLVQSKDQLNYKEKILRRESLMPSLKSN